MRLSAVSAKSLIPGKVPLRCYELLQAFDEDARDVLFERVGEVLVEFGAESRAGHTGSGARQW